MARGDSVQRTGPYARGRLAKALGSAALHGSSTIKGIPFEYRLELLARRWGITPYELEAALDDHLVQKWVQRGLIFMSLEAVEVKQQ